MYRLYFLIYNTCFCPQLLGRLRFLKSMNCVRNWILVSLLLSLPWDGESSMYMCLSPMTQGRFSMAACRGRQPRLCCTTQMMSSRNWSQTVIPVSPPYSVGLFLKSAARKSSRILVHQWCVKCTAYADCLGSCRPFLPALGGQPAAAS